MTASMISSVFLSIVSSVLVDRLDIKKVLGICFGVMALGHLLRPFAGSFPVMYAAMVLGGFSTMVMTSNLSIIAAAPFPAEKVVGVVGVIMVGGSDYRTYFTVGGIRMLLAFVCAFLINPNQK